MKLIVGLGNPEKQYDGTRHNTGFAVLDNYAAQEGAIWQDRPKFRAMLAELPSAEKVLLAKPTTYYNQVGESVRSIASFYKIQPSDILIVHDDLALPLSTLRTRVGGSGGGNNGIKSLNSSGGEATYRLRIGIDAPSRQLIGDSDFVLSRFSSEEKSMIDQLQPKIIGLIGDFLADKLEYTTQK